MAAFRKEKKQVDSVRALAWLHKQGLVNAYLVFVGKGGTLYENLTKEKIKRLKMDEFIKFCGLQKDTREYYWSASF